MLHAGLQVLRSCSCLLSSRHHTCAADVGVFVQVFVTPEEADAARKPPQWRQLFSIVWDTAKRPQLWYFVAVGFLWGKQDVLYAAETSCKMPLRQQRSQETLLRDPQELQEV